VRLLVAGLCFAALAACSSGDQVRGIVVSVDGDLTGVNSFVLRTDGGDLLTIVPAADGDFAFPLPHLNDHRLSLSPVLVTLDRSVDPPLATSLRDADSAAWHE